MANLPSENTIPIIDFSPYQSEDKRVALSETICNTLRTTGFFHLVNHGVSHDLVEEVFQKSRDFFNMPLEYKMGYLRPQGSVSLTGYNKIDQERLDPAVKMEVREAFDFIPTQVPHIERPPGFIDTLVKLDLASRDLALKVLHCFAIGLGLPDEHYFTKAHQAVAHPELESDSGNLFRTLYYPPFTPSQIDSGIVRCGTHSDYGSITLLFQDDVGGLEVESSVKGVFVPVTPVPTAVLINIGDLMARWTDDEFRSTRHRVLLNDPQRFTKARQSIPIFINPDGHTVIASLNGKSPKYPPILTRDYIMQRYAETY
ncbi:hypothetical protein BV898_00470 [Hypsibius exemplaris]|uniref:Fe2OG dioxygenase domain-containing protein n=1 Tax=Hypsibius exemplaris TaxID=2072580 RepID=A0A1W0XDU7_HYPEX|nr:hypothetical protein BV898_00470 [Hypsibius exemplaris]